LVARYIRGKHLPTYTPSMDMGSRVVIINAEKVAVTGKKFEKKLYKRHANGRPGSMKVETFEELQVRKTSQCLRNRLQMFCMISKRLGPCCPHVASSCDCLFCLSWNLASPRHQHSKRVKNQFCPLPYPEDLTDNVEVHFQLGVHNSAGDSNTTKQ
jgi:Ribosomal protein L13